MSSKYTINTEDNKRFLKENVKSLLDFGRRFPSPGGGSYYLGDDGTPWKDRSRETWITSRMAHVYSIGKMLGKISDSGIDASNNEELAEAAIRGLRGELHDDESGGWYAGITADGKILSGKMCYAHAFVILAASSALLAGISGADELLKDALDIYDRYFWNEEEGLSCDNWDTTFSVMDSYRGLNANMHTVEAFLSVADTYDILKGKGSGYIYRVRAGRIIDRVIGWAEENNYRIPEHFNDKWEADLDMNKERPDDPFKPYGATPGHGIEWARLIVQWATSFKESKTVVQNGLNHYIESACSLFDRAVTDAWNADGAEGIVYTTDWDGKTVVHDRMHWTLAEAINTSAVLYKITSQQKYADYYKIFMKYLDEKVIDHKVGSWFHQLDQNNHLKETVWPGKSDLYHAFQAMLIPYGPVDVSVAAGVKIS